MNTYIVLDLEWNQCPDGKELSVPSLPMEIIEIGAVKLDEKLNKIGEFKSLVKPVVYKRIHYRIKEVIDLKIEDLLRYGKPFKRVMKEFFKWVYKGNEEPYFCTWGTLDLLELQRNMDYHEVKNPFPFPFFYYDLQKLYSISQGKGTDVKAPLDKAVFEMGIVINKPFHDAFEDAFYSSLVMKKMDFFSVSGYQSMDYHRLPEDVREEVFIEFPNYNKYVSKAYDTKEELLENKNLKSITCIKCKKKLRKKIHWFNTSNSKIYHCLAFCPVHGYVKGKIRVRSTLDDSVYAVKTVKLVDEKSALELREKKELIAKKRIRKIRRKKNNGKGNRS
jgi:exonuclease family protein